MQTKIVYEDESLLVIYKPAGIAVEHASAVQMDVVSELKNYFRGGYVGLVHRLDQPVEGLLVVAKTKEAAAALTRQLQKGELKKSYLVLVHDERKVEAAEYDFVLRDYLYRDPKTRKAVIVEDTQLPKDRETQYKQGQEPKSAVLKGKILEKREGDILLCRIEIETGRFHQIRAQLSHVNMPLLGDRKYASESCLMLTREKGISYLALCADRLSFRHPKSGKKMEYAISPEWKDIL